MDSRELAQLQRDIAGVVTHELGSIAGALQVRAALHATDDAESVRARRALQGLAAQLRTTIQLLEFVRTVDEAPTKVPELAEGSTALVLAVEDWCMLLRSLVLAVIARGSMVEVLLDRDTPPDAPLRVPPNLRLVTMLLLAALRHQRTICGDVAVSATLTLRLADPLGMHLMLATRNGDGPLQAHARRSRWQRVAERMAAGAGGGMSWWETATPASADIRWSYQTPSMAPS